MKGDIAAEQAKGSQMQKEAKRENQAIKGVFELEKKIVKTNKGLAGSKTTSGKCKIKDQIELENKREMSVEMIHKYEDEDKVNFVKNVNDETTVMPSPTADELFGEFFNTNVVGSLKTAENETNSYSTGSVQSVSSDDEVETFSDAEHQVADVESETSSESSKSNIKSSSSPNTQAVADEEVVIVAEEAISAAGTNSSPVPNVNNTIAIDDSPKAISLISCSDDSYTPIRRSGKKRPNMFEDTDSDAEQNESTQQQEEQQSADYEQKFNVNFKRNHERKAKRIKMEEEKEVVQHSTSSSTPPPPTKEYKSRSFVSDFDQMMQKRRNERSKPHTGRRLDFITKNDDLIEELIDRMEEAAYEDRCLNEQGLPATKKVAMLKLVASQLIKKDLQPLYLEHNILSTLAEWLTPLPSKCLPCLQIREGILHILEDLPAINATLLKESGIGKTLMFLCKHPDETKKNRECCRRLIAQWARPIYNLTCDYRAMSKSERQERDIELSTRYKKQVADKSSVLKSRQPAHELEAALCGDKSSRGLRPGDHGWVPRARVPQPSTKDYVHRPQSLLNCQLSNRLRPQPNRYEALAKKHQNAKRAKSAQHSKVGLSIFGSKV